MIPALICFDLGRVLVRICDDWAHALSVAGLRPDERSPPDLSLKIHELEAGAITPAQFARDAAPLVGRSEADLHAILDGWVLGAYPGAVQLLDEIAARGVPIACLSNTNARHWQIMAGWQADEDRLWPRITHRFASHELRLRKPDAQIYAHVEKHVEQLAAPSSIVFFDDLPDNIAAANARGWGAHLVRSRVDPVAEMREVLRAAGVLGRTNTPFHPHRR